MLITKLLTNPSRPQIRFAAFFRYPDLAGISLDQLWRQYLGAAWRDAESDKLVMGKEGKKCRQVNFAIFFIWQRDR